VETAQSPARPLQQSLTHCAMWLFFTHTLHNVVIFHPHPATCGYFLPTPRYSLWNNPLVVIFFTHTPLSMWLFFHIPNTVVIFPHTQNFLTVDQSTRGYSFTHTLTTMWLSFHIPNIVVNFSTHNIFKNLSLKISQK
jgi:hypothetical protein